MSKAVYLIFFLATLLAVIFTPADASPLEKKRDTRKKDCCPLARCVFKKFDTPVISPRVTNSNYNGNTFSGFLTFVETPSKKQLGVRGWIDIDGVIPLKNPFGGPDESVEGFYDIHVAECKTANTDTPGDSATIDLDDQGFKRPIFANFASKAVNDVKGKCCFVVEEFAKNKGSSPKNERILGIAPVEVVESCQQ